MDYVLVSALHIGHHCQSICVRASRVWSYRGGIEAGEVKDIRMVLIDERGQSIYAVVTTGLVAKYSGVLHEAGVYVLRHFEVATEQSFMNLVENPLVVKFTPLTLVQPVLNPHDEFPQWTYRLTSFEDLPAPNDAPLRFVDVIGVIRGISNVAVYSMAGKNAPTCRRRIVIADSGGHEIMVNLWGEAAWRFNGQVVLFLGQEELAVIIFVGTTVHAFGGSKELAGAAACKWYINENIEDIAILRAELQAFFKPIVELPTPHQLNLRSQVNGRYPLRTLSILQDQDLFNNQGGLFRCTVRIWRFTPGQPWWVACCARCKRLAMPTAFSPTQPAKYTCSNAECTCLDASLRYHLRLLSSDGTGEAEFKLFGQITEDTIGVSVRQVILNNYRSNVPIANVAAAAAQIRHTPPELSAVISSRHMFLLHVTNNSFNGRWASFNVHTVEASYPPEN